MVIDHQHQKNRNRHEANHTDHIGKSEDSRTHLLHLGHSLSVGAGRKLSALSQRRGGVNTLPLAVEVYRGEMSCIRFNTTAQREQLAQAVSRADGDGPVAAFLSPAITESKIARIRVMSLDPNPKIRESAALSYHAPLEVYEALAVDPNEGVRTCLARNAQAPCDVLRTLARDSSDTVRGFVAINFSVPEDAMALLSQDKSPTVQKLVAWKSALKEDSELISA